MQQIHCELCSWQCAACIWYALFGVWFGPGMQTCHVLDEAYSMQWFCSRFTCCWCWVWYRFFFLLLLLLLLSDLLLLRLRLLPPSWMCHHSCSKCALQRPLL